jgi:hypothetical protein
MAVAPVPQVSLKLPKPKNQAEAKREQVRDLVFPNSAQDIYDRKVHNGYSTIPRTLGLMLSLIELLAPRGKNPSRVYCELWFRTYDDKLIEVKDEEEFAYASGISVRRWRERVDVLEQLGFIKVAPNGNRRYGYILLRNPNNVVLEMKRQEKDPIPSKWWNAYVKRSVEIGYKVSPIMSGHEDREEQATQ